ncbi:Ig-like domain-containing protein [Spirosoma sp. KNUC1025]|uniref:Ig-like domain-containing protein n=1 Tax=Spirosoma sp. KNUC1025 TaxID=2894082 RepID=UPI00386A0766|nr:Ig-like domain-containing protein [Spirosoma sp. KNUC1025]
MVTLIFGRPVIGIYKLHRQILVRLCALCSLIFFIASLFTACRQPEKNSDILIRWDGKRATGISIPSELVQSIAADSLDKLLSVRLANQKTAIAGQYQLIGDDVVFEPLIPLTRGLHYVVWLKNKQLGEVMAPALATNDKPELLAVYPTQDSLPDNLLKIYLHFSRPMREGQSLKYVALLKNNTDTLPGVFLNLQPELWNADRTTLTLWLDPGRIKRDLQPNKQLGTPLQGGNRYQLVVSADWPDEQGATLGKPISKSFVTFQRDSLSPNPKRWSIHRPQSGSIQPMGVSFGEALDYVLLTETLHVIQADKKLVSGTWQIGENENRAWFKPTASWQPGQYTLRIESRLEDVAGNNLNRLFDRDITRKDQPATSHPFVDLPFVTISQ